MTHPITPPRELVEQWASEKCYDERDWLYELHIANRAAQWGADQELEACCEWLVSEGWFKYEHEAVEDLRAARRSKPPSLKEQALAELERVDMLWDTNEFSKETLGALDTIRRALEQLDD
jgi:hypothetical protein